MHSKVKILGHPIHPMLVGYPVAFYTATLVAAIIFAADGDTFWFKVSVVTTVAGVAMALLTAIPGFIDWAFGVPGAVPTKSRGWRHMLFNVAALAVFAVNLGIHVGDWNSSNPEMVLGIVLPAVGVLLTIMAGFLGWTLVQDDHVGVRMTAEQEHLEPSVRRAS